MGESSVCLVRSLSQPSPTSSEEKKMNHMQRALTTSVSFGRFMSESLDWVKWSAFTQNRYLEEVEKYSKPGSVAEKKAYFEAHFKRRRAAALFEQQNAASNATAGDPFEANKENKVADYTPPDLNLAQRGSLPKNTNQEEIQKSCPVFSVSHNDTSAKRIVEVSQPGGVQKSTKPRVVMESPVELTSHLENDGYIDNDVSKLEDKACDKGDSIDGKTGQSIEKKPEVSSVLLKKDSAPKCPPSTPVKLIIPVQLKNSEKTPDSQDNAKDPGSKRRSYTTSLHMSISLASCLGEKQKVAPSPLRPKIENTSLNRAPAKKFKNSMRSQTTSTTESVNGIFMHHVGTTPQENRNVTIHSNSMSQSRTLDGKVQFPSSKCSKSTTTLGCKARLPTVSCPFTFKSEERAAKRKEKQEQKLKSSETEKQIPHANSQVKARDNPKNLDNSIAPKATKNPVIISRTDVSNNSTKKIPSVRPPWRFSVKTEGSSDATAKNKHLAIDNSTKL